MGEKNNGILEKISPNSPFIIHHSSFPLSPLLLNSFVLHFFKRQNSYGKCNFQVRRWFLPYLPTSLSFFKSPPEGR